MIAESHIHLSHRSFENTFSFLSYDGKEFCVETDGTRETLIQRMKESGIAFCIEPGVSLESNQTLLDLSRSQRGFLFPAVGVHPTRTYQYSSVGAEGEKTVKHLRWRERKQIARFAGDPSVVAIGETGLDYHHERKEQHRLRQKAWFLWQLALAGRMGLPVILHIREADRDALRILRRVRTQLHGGVCHCFCGDAETARAYTGLGLALGIGGSLLARPELRANLEEAVRATPLDMLLLETDGPYVKPECPNLNGKQRKKARNTSLILPAVAARIAELKGVSREEVERVTLENAVRIFGLPLG